MFRRRLRYLLGDDGRRTVALNFAASLGAIWLLIEFSSFFFPDLIKKGAVPFWACLVISAIIGLTRAWPRAHYTRAFRNVGIEIEVRVGDMLAAGTDIAIASSDFLDTCPDTVHQRSLIAQLVQRYFSGVHGNLDEQIDAFMRKQGIVGHEQPGKTKGKKVQYPVGTVAVVNFASQHVYLVVAALMDADTVTKTGARDLWVSLCGLWESVDRFGSQRPITVPIWGASLARAPTSSRTALFDLLMLSFIMHNRQHKMTSRLTVMIWGADYRPDEFEHFIRTIDNLPL